MLKYILAIPLLFLATISTSWATSPIGHVTKIEGHATRIHHGTHEKLGEGSSIHLHDQITTDDKSTLKITFIDETQLILGAGSDMTIDEYAYTPEGGDANKASFNMDESVFHYISGLLTKTENPNVTIDLVYGSIGIRGTQIWRDMIDDEGHKTCRIYLEDGTAEVTNKGGKVTLNHGDGTKIKSLETSPEAAKPWGQAAIEDIKAKTRL